MSKMGTEKAIEYLEEILASKRFVWSHREYTIFKSIIALLQQGEKTDIVILVGRINNVIKFQLGLDERILKLERGGIND